MDRPIRPSEIRAAALLAELDRAATEYKDALNEFEGVRQRLEAAKEKFAGVRRLAPDVLPPREWFDWQYRHQELWMVGLDIGEAISQTLRSRAIDAAMKTIDSNSTEPFNPWMSSWEIVDTLGEQGFEFRTATPRREVHACLLHLRGVAKQGQGRYGLKEADEIYNNMREGYASEMTEGERQQRSAVARLQP